MIVHRSSGEHDTLTTMLVYNKGWLVGGLVDRRVDGVFPGDHQPGPLGMETVQ